MEDEIEKVLVQLVDGFAEEVPLQHSCRSGECTQAAGTFGAAKVAGGGGFKGD